MMFFFFKQKTAYERRISDWSSDVCSSDLPGPRMPTVSRRDAGAGGADVRLTRLKARADGIRFALQYENQTAAQSKLLRQTLQNLELAIRGMEMTRRRP